MPIINFPPTFDLNYYRDTHSELNFWSDAELTAHYEKFADAQGLSSCPYDRSETLQQHLQDIIERYHIKTLEISPWDNPFLHGDSVKYFDIEDAESLRKSAVEASRHSNNVPEKIHFVSPTGDLNVVDEKFDIVFSAHVIEHCPDLIAHFQAVSRILNAGGLYVLIIPDKRFCLDHYNADSTISDVIDAFVCERKFPRLADVINSIFTSTHSNAVRHWLGDHGEQFGLRDSSTTESAGVVKILDEYFFDDGKNLPEKIFRVVEKYAETLERGEYVSVHNWRFTPNSFGGIVNLLNKFNFIALPLYRLCHTIWGRFEFIAILERR